MDFSAFLTHEVLDRPLAVLRVGPFAVPITKHTVMIWIAGAIMLALFAWIARDRALIPSRLRNFFEMIIVFVRDEIVYPNLGPYTDRYLGYFLTLFFFIFFCNLLGLVPFGASATMNISVTATLALCTFVLVNVSGMIRLGPIGYFKNMIPPHMPWWLIPFLYGIEIIGMITKHFALCIRLFANMFAGHMSILVLLGLIFIFPNMVIQLTIAPVSVFFALGISLLEIFIAVLQTYIFTMLTALFTGMAMYPQH